MSVHHIGKVSIRDPLRCRRSHFCEVLFKLKPNTTKEQIAELKDTVKAMVGQIPGLQKAIAQ